MRRFLDVRRAMWGLPARASPQPWRVAALSIAVTAAIAAAYQANVDRRDDLRMANAQRSTEDRVRMRLEIYVALLYATRGLLAGSERVTGEEFHAFVGQLGLDERYPGIQGIGYALRFPWADRDRVAAETGVRPWPGVAREEATSIVLLEPDDRRNTAALGYDMTTEPTRREAMARARDSGLPAASGPVTLVQEIDPAKQTGFLVYLPVYAGGQVPPTVEARRAALQGYAYSPFRTGDLFEGIFGTEQDSRLVFAIHDGDATLYRSAGFTGTGAPRLRSELEVAGRTWTIEVEATSAFHDTSGVWATPWILAIGALVTVTTWSLAVRQRRSEDLLRLRSRVLDSMSEGVIVTEADGTVVYTNPAEDRMFGYAPGELLGEPAARLTADAETYARVAEEVSATVTSKGSWSGELENVRRDGTRLLTSTRVATLEVAGRRCWVTVQEDITERKLAERQRAELLDREQVARAEAQEANRVKDEFLAMLGHELRNPLAPIVTSVELLRRRYGADEPRLAVVARQVAQLRRLVEDLLDVSRVARGRISLDRRPLDLREVLHEAVEAVTPLVQQRQHQLSVDAPAPLVVDGDPGRLAQVFTNLLTNAAKYTDPGGHVDVLARREGDEIVVVVRDDGMGIAPAQLSRVFELFTQGPRAADRAEGGLGIGLAVVRALVELHGGRILAHSEGPGRGSAFEVRLPAGHAAPPAEPDRHATSPVRAARSLRVLVVDDNVDAARSLADLLALEGHAVDLAFDAEQALALATGGHHDVAILDLGLPGMDGVELAERLDEPRPVLFALTGYGAAEDRARTAAAGFRDHFTKPVDVPRLLTALAEVARR